MELFAVLALTLVVLLKAAEAEPIQTGDFSNELARHPELKKYVDQAIAAVEARFEAKYRVLQGKLTEHETNNLALRKELSEYAIKQAKFESENTMLREELRKHTSSLEKFEAQNRLLQQQVDKLGEKLQRDSAKFNPSLQTNRINEKLETNVTEPMDYQAHHDIHDKLVKVVQEQNNYSRLKGNMRDGQRIVKKNDRLKRDRTIANAVAFFETANKDIKQIGANQTIRFDHAVTNVGNAYNVDNGTFVAPSSGIYLFSTTLFRLLDGPGATRGDVVVNGQVVARMRLSQEHAAQTVVVHLRKGDDVLVQNAVEDKSVRGDGMTRRGLMVRAGAVENMVAFFATLSNTMRHLGANQDIPFDHVITNVGNAYNGNHGTFIAPTTGIYLFATTLMHPWDHAESYGHFVVSGKVVAKLRVENYQSSQTIIVRLNQGDDVSVQNTAVDKEFHGDSYSSFAGVLLYEDFSSPVVVG